MTTSKLLFASAAAGIALTGSAQAVTVTDVLYNLAATNGFIGVPAAYDFNDVSLSTNLSGTSTVAPGDVIEGVFTIDSISLSTLGGSFVDSIDLSSAGVEVFGRFTLTIGTVGPAITTTVAGFEIFEDDRLDGVRSVTVPSGLTGSVAYNSASWGGAGGIGTSAQGGSLFAGLDINSGGSYTLIPLGSDLAILPDLNIIAGAILNPSLGVTGNVGGTGTVSPTNVPGEFTDRASFKFNATVLPSPTAAAGGLVLAGLAAARRRRIHG